MSARIRTSLRGGKDVLASWLEGDPDLYGFVTSLAAVYRRGYGELAVALHAAGWRDQGAGILNPVVDALQRLRAPGSSVADTRLAIAAVHHAVATDSLYGKEFRRSAGLTGRAADDPTEHLRWWARQLELTLGLGRPA